MLDLVHVALVVLHDPLVVVRQQLRQVHELVQAVVGVVEEQEEEALGGEGDGGGDVQHLEVGARATDARDQLEGDVLALMEVDAAAEVQLAVASLVAKDDLGQPEIFLNM